MLYPEVSEVADVAWLPPPKLLAVFYKLDPSLLFRWDWHKIPVKSAERHPGTGKLTGEEFRIVEPDADYLRLVGRGGDEYLAWDFVLGTLDTGEWVLMAEDGLYKAEKEGDKVVEGPYHGYIYDVRGPPYMPFYPVVPVKWVRERLERAREKFKVDVYTPPVDPQILLKWPLRNVEWEFKVYPLTYEEFVRFGPPRGADEVAWFDCTSLCDVDEHLARVYKVRACGDFETGPE